MAISSDFPQVDRRLFLKAGGLAAGALAAGALPLGRARSAAGGRKWRAAIIGFTGGGDYGHGYDRAFTGVPGVRVVAAADPDPAGRARAARRSGAERTYADYRRMLRVERPELVSIAFRHPRRHLEVALAAFEAGAHVILEKPMTETLPQADELVRAARRAGVHVAVAHSRRYMRDFQRLAELIRRGFLGEIREIHIHGKQDSRVGGEDMIVLGVHDFDMLRWFFGDPAWCFGNVLQGGRDATPADAREGREPIRVAGDTVRACFGFSGNFQAAWCSVAAGDGWNRPKGPREHWAFEILGTRRVAAWQSLAGMGLLDSPDLLHMEKPVPWKPLPEPEGWAPPPYRKSVGLDLLHAVESGEPPASDALAGRWTLEMVAAVYQSHFRRERVAFPLRDRRDPLAPAS